MLSLRQRLLFAFISIAIAVLGIFGIVAHHVTNDFATEAEIHTLTEFVKEKAAALGGLLPGKTIQEVNRILEQHNRHSELPVLLLDRHSRVVATSPVARLLNLERINGYFAKLPHGKTGGTLPYRDDNAMWAFADIPGTNYRLAILHGEERDLSLVDALGVKLFASAFLIIWVTAWAAMVLSNVISRRLDEQNAVLLHQALHDQLTDLPNRRQLFDHLQLAIHHARRSKHTFALLLIELGNLKEINDTLGHQSGDELLKMIGPRLGMLLQEGDTIARLEGSEFAILLPGLEKDEITDIVHRIIEALEHPFIISDMELEVRASIGVALYPDHSDEPKTLFRQADVAMCLSKAHGSEFMIYSAETDPTSVEQLTLMSELRHAITGGELQLYYQPKLDLRTLEVVGAEALLRWFHPQRGMIPPDDFIPKAEQTGLIKPLTRWVIEQAFQQAHAWHKQGLQFQVAINVSQRSLYDRELINQIADTMQRLEITNCVLDIEITETAIMAHPEQSLATLQMLSKMGVHLAIDDFGTGFTSLSYLKELPVDELKIDKSFVMRMLDDSQDVMIVRSIIELAHSLGRVVVAEGVESQEILDLLRNMNCDTAQGFYMARPLPAAEFEQWLNKSIWKPKSANRA